jgi:hypothetical protein
MMKFSLVHHTIFNIPIHLIFKSFYFSSIPLGRKVYVRGNRRIRITLEKEEKNKY